MQFDDRAEAGRVLAEALRAYRGRKDLIVLALPRGGVPVGYEVARSLGAPLDAFVVRKLGVPGYAELAMGAIASGGIRVLNKDVVAALGPTAQDAIEQVTEAELAELRSRERRYRDDRPPPDLRGRCVILVDDGLATGATMRAAARAIRQRTPSELVVAVPVAAESSCIEMRAEADVVICASTPEPFYGVGQFYRHFSQTSDEEVRELLERATDPNA
ncbi:MAG: putative phosphoribosyl transferase [Verrucomicrobiota bacterium]|jgi:predicted phosphoribosyltransferase